jgi:hypothetical protein
LKANSEIWQFLVHFSFKWNDAFCTKQRRFTHYSLKKTRSKVLFLQRCTSSSSFGRAKAGRRRFFFPSFVAPLSLSLSETQKNQ